MLSWIDALLMPFVAQDWSFEGRYAYHTNGCVLYANAYGCLCLKTPVSEEFEALVELDAPLDWPLTLETLSKSFDPARVNGLQAQLAFALWRSHPGRWVFLWSEHYVMAKYYPPQKPTQAFDQHALKRLLPLYDDILQLQNLLIQSPLGYLSRFQMTVITPSTWHELLEKTGLPNA